MRSAERVRSFEEYVAGRRTHLRRLAFGLCGDWHRADDLVQTALEKAYLSWPKLRRAGAEDAFVRTILVRANIDESRRGWRREHPTETLPEVAAPGPEPSGADALGVALRALPPQQRAAVLLRYWCDLSVAQTAAELGVSEGTVKSQTSRGTAVLRALLAADRVSAGC